jgi:PAS domain S-box-containing protein
VLSIARAPSATPVAVHIVGTLIVLLIAAIAAWTIWHERELVRHNAESHLSNVATVLAEQTRVAFAANDDLRNALLAAHEEPARADRAGFHAQLGRLYGDLALGYTGRVLLLSPGGVVVTTYPLAPDAIGARVGAHPMFAQAAGKAEADVIAAPGIVDVEAPLIAHRTVRDFPLVIAVSAPTRGIFEQWRADAVRIGLGALLVAVLTALGTFLLARQLRITETLGREARENELRLNSIISSAMDAIITIDHEQRIILFNTAAETIFGVSTSEAIGLPIDRFIPERYRAAHVEHVRRFGQAGSTMRRMGADLVLTGMRGNGEEFPIDASISHVTVAGRRYYTVILRDITERQNAAARIARSHQELRDLYEAMHEVREGERTRIARELHDELAQWLTALKMDAAAIGSRLAPDQQQLATRVERMKGIVDSAVASMRRIAADLRPVALDDLGLVAALESLLSDLSERSEIEVSLDGDGAADLSLPDTLATALYRMVQEALTNVARHSGGTKVTVSLQAQNGMLRAEVRDNGRGLNPDSSRKSFGLLGIRERARTLGGEARIYSPDTGGTVVEIEVPLPVDAVAEDAS